MVHRFIPEIEVEGEQTYLKKLIDDGTHLQNAEGQKVRGSLYASDYGQCQRKTWFQFHPKDFLVDPIDARVLRIFHNGNDVHNRLGSYLKRNKELGFVDEVNVPRDDLDVHGRCDGICTVDGRAVVVEFKSINKDSVEEPKEEHVGQLTWYLSMFKKLRKDVKEDFGFAENDIVLPGTLVGEFGASGAAFADLGHVEKWLLFTQGEMSGEIIYESKSKNDTYHFPLEYNEGKAKKVRLWFQQVKWHLDKDEIPSVKYNQNYFPCSWRGGKCQFFDQCWGPEGIGQAGMKREELLQLRSKK